MQYLIQRTSLTLQPEAAIVRTMQDPSSKSTTTEAPEKQYPEKRGNRRAKIVKPLRVRPSEPRDEHFEDLPISVNASRDGIFFTTRRENYYKGMRVFVTFPYTSPHDPMNCEYVAEVVRVAKLPNGKFGIAVRLLMTLNYDTGASPGPVTRI